MFISGPQKGGILRAIGAIFTRDKLGELLVIGGYISAQDLKAALRLQKSQNKPLGQVLIAQNLISPWQLKKILFRQRSLRLMAAVFLCVVSFTGFGKKVQADVIDDIPALISIVSDAKTEILYEPLVQHPALFGSEEKSSENMKAFTKWIGMFEKFEADMNTEAGKKIVHDLQKELLGYKSASIYKMADKVNRFMNRQRYILDQNNWGKSDYWATPIEFMTRGGDCEDFSIAKYAALRALGVPESRLRLAIVHDEKKNIPHAVLIVYAETGPVILDNQNKEILSDSSILHYRPIYSINRQAWWLHTAPEANVVASAR